LGVIRPVFFDKDPGRQFPTVIFVSTWSELSSRWISGQDGNIRVAEMVLGLGRISTAISKY
jgi:hypothetical protein